MDLTHSSIGYRNKEGNAEHAGYSNDIQCSQETMPCFYIKPKEEVNTVAELKIYIAEALYDIK